jgi:hypothetical protein
MSSVVKTIGLLLMSLVTTGCFNPAITRLPEVAAGQPQVEKRSFERHDPFPDRALGPDMQVRPRAYNDQRTVPRKSLEERLFQGTSDSVTNPAAGPDLRGAQYKDSVRY